MTPGKGIKDYSKIISLYSQCCLEYFEIIFSAPLGIFSDCNNQWCLQQGLNKPQHTKCESVTNNGYTCNNPQIKYGSVEGGIPREHIAHSVQKLRDIINKLPRTFDCFLSLYDIHAYIKSLK